MGGDNGNRRIVAIAAVIAIGVLGACVRGGPGAARDDSVPAGSPPVVLPASALPRMTSEGSSVDAERLANEVAHPDALRTVLDDAGFASGAQRSFGAGPGAFSRVVARGLTFASDEGAASYVAWFRAHAGEEILTSRLIEADGVPDGAVVLHHEPDGCCHNDVPVFLAAWQRGSTVLSLHAGGRRANLEAFLDLVRAYDAQV